MNSVTYTDLRTNSWDINKRGLIFVISMEGEKYTTPMMNNSQGKFLVDLLTFKIYKA